MGHHFRPYKITALTCPTFRKNHNVKGKPGIRPTYIHIPNRLPLEAAPEATKKKEYRLLSTRNFCFYTTHITCYILAEAIATE